MADKKISDLNLLSSADATDLVPVVDVSANLTKRTTVAGLAAAVAANVPDGAFPFSKGDGKTWWEELGRTTLTSPSDTLTVNSLPNKRYLRLMFATSWTGNINVKLQFNGDSGNSYAYRVSRNGAADATQVSFSSIGIISTAASERVWFVADIVNVLSREKQVMVSCMTEGATGAANTPNRHELIGKWANTTSVISSVTVFNDGPGDFQGVVGNEAELIVLGHN